MKKIYLAGPYDGQNVIEILGNIRRGLEYATLLLQNGFAVYCPFTDFLFGLLSGSKEISKDIFQDNSMAWVDVCDVILMLPGWENSNGAKRELSRATSLGKGVCYDITLMLDKRFKWE